MWIFTTSPTKLLFLYVLVRTVTVVDITSRFHVVVVVVVVLTLTRIIKSVVTGQAPVNLELRNTPGKNTNMGPEGCAS